MRRTLIALAIASAVAMPAATQAKTLRWAAQGDILTFDPHSQNEGMTIAANSYIYEPLVDYDKDFKVVPRLATSWEQVSPTLYRFKLREGVKFHDGSAFTADDAVFSVHRAMAPTSNYKAYTTGIKEARKIDDHTIEIETTAPNPVLLRQLPNVFIMSRAWSEKHNVAKPQDFVNKEETFAARNTNGTGPYKLKSREVDVRTTFEENPDWWNKKDKVGNVTEVIFTPSSRTPPARPRCCPARSTSCSIRPPRTWTACASKPRSWKATSTAPSISAMTRSVPSCCTPASRARTPSRTCACARRCTAPSTSRPSSAP